jgi:hypothetical protein
MSCKPRRSEGTRKRSLRLRSGQLIEKFTGSVSDPVERLVRQFLLAAEWQFSMALGHPL